MDAGGAAEEGGGRGENPPGRDAGSGTDRQREGLPRGEPEGSEAATTTGRVGSDDGGLGGSEDDRAPRSTGRRIVGARGEHPREGWSTT